MNQFDFSIRYVRQNKYRALVLTFFAKDATAAEALCKKYLVDGKFEHWEIRKVTAKEKTTA